MKIALVSPYDFAFPGGVTVHISRLAEQFTDLGHTVRILSPASQSAEALGVKNLTVLGRPVPIPSGGSVARVTISLRLARPVRRILAQEKFDIIHLHEPLLPTLPIEVLRASRTINVGTFHAYHGSSWRYRYASRILRRWFRRLHGKIAVSRPAEKFIARYFPGYYNIIPNGIDLKLFNPQVEPLEEYRDDKVNILFVGRLEKRKGLQYLLGAYGRLKGSHPNIRLLVVGADGGQGGTLERMAAERELKDVTFCGYVPYEDLPRYYQTADICCVPSTGKESFGLVLLEAMAIGKPLVCSRIEGYASVVDDGEEGLLVPPKKEEPLAQALARTIEDEGLRHRLGAQGLAKAQEYGWDRVARKVLAYYERLLQEVSLTRRGGGIL